MPRQDWNGDDYMTRDRDYRDFDARERGYGGYERDRGAFFGNRDREQDMRRRSLMRDESSGSRRFEERPGRSRQEFGPDDYNPGIPTDETERLIASNKVEGTPVYDMGGERLGSIHNFMVDKFRGKVVYAVLKHSSGFLGLDDRYYPLDWDQLTFDTRLGGYRIDMTEDDLKRSGSWDRNERWRGRDRGRESMRDRDVPRPMMRESW
jgi:sporulation protein YlmC with PRC-barrel domain